MKKKIFPLRNVYQLIEPGPVVMVTTVLDDKPNIMTMSWHMMLDFEPPIIALVMSNRNYSFELLRKTKECVINIPTVELAKEVVGVGNCSGKRINKFKKFNLTPEEATYVKPPLIKECYANIECRVVDASMMNKYNIFIVEGLKAWISTAKKRARTIHHQGNGIFAVDGKLIKLPSKKK